MIETRQAPFRTVPFAEHAFHNGIKLNRHQINMVQINLGKLCNQSCIHCHIEAGPRRTEIMDCSTAECALDFVQAANPQTVDLTGGAPELNPSFRWLVEGLVRGGFHVINRCNLTVFSEPGQTDCPDLLAALGVEIVASLPCYTKENVDYQRGEGVYDKSIHWLRRLNALGYGRPGSGLILNLVYNPLGVFLPPSQAELESDYRRELETRHSICFNRLVAITNVPLGRFGRLLQHSNELDRYRAALFTAFNSATLDRLMCRNMISVSWDGLLYDCDFNQISGRPLGNAEPFRLGEQPASELAAQLVGREVLTGMHCYACTAGAGSSCGGALA